MTDLSRIKTLSPGDTLPGREFCCDNVQLFFYNASLWNAHRIHYDYPYATQVEGYPGLVVAGPLMGDWLTQCVLDWIDQDATLVSFEYSNRKACYTGDVLHFAGKLVSVEPDTGLVTLELLITDQEGDAVTPGRAVVGFPVN